MGKSKVENSLCTILRYASSKKTEGVGTFISPRTILTAAHVVSDAEVLEITGAKGHKTSDVAHIHYAYGLDVAIITLRESVRHGATSLVSKAPAVQGAVTGKVSAIFAGQKRQHPISLCRGFDMSNGSARFWSMGDVQPGYSGSPITDNRGKIFSIATAIYGDGMTNDNGQKPFLGIEPKAFLKFVNSVQL